MTVYTTNGKTYHYVNARPFLTKFGTLQVITNSNGYVGGDVIAEFPLANVERWES